MQRLQQILNYVLSALALLGLAGLGVEVAFPEAFFLPPMRLAALLLHGLFVLDVAIRLLLSQPHRRYLTRHWADCWVLVPMALFLSRGASSAFGVFSRETALILMVVSRARRAQALGNLLVTQPAQTAIKAFALVIFAGAILLMLPEASATGAPISLLDALFTATSATCVTGLAVLDTAAAFTVFGQLVILTLIQLGGLGIMTLSVCVALLVGRAMDVRQQATLQSVMDFDALGGLRRLVLFIVGMTAAFELAGALLLTGIWLPRFDSFSVTLYHAVFHSISAFCNAGFSTFSASLAEFRGDALTNLVVCSLIVGGGIGFLAIHDLSANAFGSLRRRSLRALRLRAHTRLVLWASILLIAGGGVAIYWAESAQSFRDMPRQERILAALFQSVSARTAGFNSCDIAALAPASAFALIVLMFIGASPGSTGGGIKTTTAAVLWATVASTLRQREHVELLRHSVPVEIVRKALSVLCLALLVACLFTALLALTEKAPFLDILFETVSALGTVGLSRGHTPNLTPEGKSLIALLMFIGRLGPLSMAYALTMKRQPARYQYAEARFMIG